MNIKALKKNDFSYADTLASLHAKNINGKLSNIGVKFLSKIYLTFLQDKNIRIWILVHKKKAIGFLCGCDNNEKIYKKFLLKNFPFLIFLFLSNILNLFFIKNVYGLIILFLNPKKNYQLILNFFQLLYQKNFKTNIMEKD